MAHIPRRASIFQSPARVLPLHLVQLLLGDFLSPGLTGPHACPSGTKLNVEPTPFNCKRRGDDLPALPPLTTKQHVPCPV